MTYDEAVAELHSEGENSVGGYIRRATASPTYYAHYITRSDHPAPRKRPSEMTDAEFDTALARRFGDKRENAMKTTRDAIAPEYKAEWTPMGRASGGKVGGIKVMNLPGQLTGYYIGRDEQGRVALFYHGSADDVIDPGTTHDRAAVIRNAREREAAEHLHLRSIGARSRAFWERHGG